MRERTTVGRPPAGTVSPPAGTVRPPADELPRIGGRSAARPCEAHS